MQPIAAMRLCCSRTRESAFRLNGSCSELIGGIGQVTALQGLIGIVRNQRIITSPNVTWVPEIQWQNCQVGLCQDMRFSIDDYTQWPQWYHEKFPYLAAIPRRPSNGSDSPYACMWWTPCTTDFITAECCAVDKRPGYLHKRFEQELSTLRGSLLRDAYRILDELRDSQDFTNKSSSMGSACTCVRHSWMILTEHAGTFDEKRLEFAEFQRAWLELKGMVNYVEWEKAATLNSGSTQPVQTKGCVCCIVENPHVAMTLFEMGIPFWFVRDKMSVLQGDVYIAEATSQMMKPTHHGEIFSTTYDPSFPIIYKENPRNLIHYHVQHQFSRIRAVIQHVSPTTGHLISKEVPKWLITHRDAVSMLVDIQTMRAQTSAGADHAALVSASASAGRSTSSATTSAPSTALSTSSSRAKSHSKAKRHHPCEPTSFNFNNFIPTEHLADAVPTHSYSPSGAPQAAPVLNDLFAEATGLGEPYAIPSWTSAIARIDRSRPAGEKHSPPNLYTFPGPKLFTAINTLRLQTFVTSWLHIRPRWIGQVSSRTPNCDLALKAQTWRDILKFGMGGPQPGNLGKSSLAKIQEDMSRCSLAVSNDMRTITFDNGERLSVEPSRISGLPSAQVVVWKNLRYNFLENGVAEVVFREMLWELHELNFRFDLIRLDACLAKDAAGDLRSALKRQDMLLKCWGSQADAFYDPTHIDWLAHDRALAAPAMEHRIRYVRYLHDLCSTWQNFPMPQDMAQIDDDLEEGMGQYHEGELYAAIQQTFFDLFGRPMVPPRRLFR